jgi:hypothetical protein
VICAPLWASLSLNGSYKYEGNIIMYKFVTESNSFETHILPFFSEFLGRSPPSIWGFRNEGPGVVAIYGGPAGGPILERCELQPGDVTELRGAHFVLQSRDRLGARVFIASL